MPAPTIRKITSAEVRICSWRAVESPPMKGKGFDLAGAWGLAGALPAPPPKDGSFRASLNAIKTSSNRHAEKIGVLNKLRNVELEPLAPFGVRVLRLHPRCFFLFRRAGLELPFAAQAERAVHE